MEATVAVGSKWRDMDTLGLRILTVVSLTEDGKAVCSVTVNGEPKAKPTTVKAARLLTGAYRAVP